MVLISLHYNEDWSIWGEEQIDGDRNGTVSITKDLINKKFQYVFTFKSKN